MKLPDAHHISPEDYYLLADTWRQEWEKGVQVLASPDTIPQPSLRWVHHSSRSVERGHSLSLSYSFAIILFLSLYALYFPLSLCLHLLFFLHLSVVLSLLALRPEFLPLFSLIEDEAHL